MYAPLGSSLAVETAVGALLRTVYVCSMLASLGNVARSRPGSHAAMRRPSPSWADSVVRPLGSTLRVAIPQAGSRGVVMSQPSALVTLVGSGCPALVGVNLD